MRLLFKNLILFSGLFLIVSNGLSQKDYYKMVEINLTSNKPSEFEEVRFVRGGSFVEGGWQSVDSLNYIMVMLKDGFAYNESGAIELEMTNLNPMTQATGGKQHFFNLYANPEGYHFGYEYRDGEWIRLVPAYPFFSLRFGDNKYKDNNGQGIKVLWRPNEKRYEKAPFGTRKDWSLQKNYVWRAEWDTDSLSIFLDDERIFGPAEFDNRDKNAQLRYIWIGKDNHKNEKLWFGFAGPIYKKIRVYYEK